MSIRRTYILLSIYITLALVPNASAGLYGFSRANPPTKEEQILDIEVPPRHILNYRQKMRDNIEMLADYAHARIPEFQIIVHEGEQLLNKSLWEYHLAGYNDARRKGINADDPSFLYKLNSSRPEESKLAGQALPKFINKIDGIALNNVFCGNRKLSNVLRQSGLKLMAIDQCPNDDSFDEAIQESFGEGLLLQGFLNPQNAFNNVHKQPIINENARNIFQVADAKNFLILNDDSNYANKYDLIRDLQNTNFDLIVIPPLFHGTKAYTPEEVQSLRFKKNGTTRLIMAEMNLSEADPRSYYWRRDWKTGSPDWLVRPSFVTEQSVITRYWEDSWRRIIAAYLQSIVNSGFSGVFMTGLQNHLYFEKLLPLE